MTPRSRSQLLIGILATLALTTLSLAAVAIVAGPRTGEGFANNAGCAVPDLAGTVVNVAETEMGGPMMGRSGRMGGMRLTADHATVPHGTVSLLVTNVGRYAHELVILALPDRLSDTFPISNRVEDLLSLKRTYR